MKRNEVCQGVINLFKHKLQRTVKHDSLSLVLPMLDLSQVELEFLPFQDVSITSTNLTRSGGDAGCRYEQSKEPISNQVTTV